MPHNLIQKKLINLIETTFHREGTLYLAGGDKIAFLTSDDHKRFKFWSCRFNILDNIIIRFVSKLHRQIVGIPMGTDCAPLKVGLFLFCYERDSMISLSADTQTDVIKAFNSTSRYLDDLLNIDTPYFNKMVKSVFFLPNGS